jgi:putative ABC transport system substrate-binding protein
MVLPHPLFNSRPDVVVGLAAARRVPAIYPFRSYAEAGGLMSFGIDIPDSFRRAAYFVDRILKGAKPADLPVEQPTKIDLVVNQKTAKSLGIAIPHSVLLRADEVIQ